jgi:hypothetical protein
MTYYYYYYYHRNPNGGTFAVYISRRRAGDTARRSFARENRLFSPSYPGAGAINGPAAALSHGGGDVDGGGDRHTTADGHTTNIIR